MKSLHILIPGYFAKETNLNQNGRAKQSRRAQSTQRIFSFQSSKEYTRGRRTCRKYCRGNCQGNRRREDCSVSRSTAFCLVFV
jgi:hypothetical protein